MLLDETSKSVAEKSTTSVLQQARIVHAHSMVRLPVVGRNAGSTVAFPHLVLDKLRSTFEPLVHVLVVNGTMMLDWIDQTVKHKIEKRYEL